MRHYYLLFLLIFSGVLSTVRGQTTIDTIDKETLPVIGDTIVMITDSFPYNDPAATDLQRLWDFRHLKTTGEYNVIYKEPDTSKYQGYFINANMMVASDDGTERFYALKDGNLNLIGFAGIDPVGFNIFLKGTFNDAIPEIITPMYIGRTYSTSSELTMPVNAKQLPDSILKKFPIYPDVGRLKSKFNIEIRVDTIGTLSLPQGDVECIRIYRKDLIYNYVEIQTLFGWLDVTGFLPDGTISLIDTAITYRYYSPDSKGPWAVVYTESSGKVPYKVDYKISSTNNKVINKDFGPEFKMTLFPNPTNGTSFYLNVKDAKSDNYIIRMYDIYGRQVFERTYYLDGDQVKQIVLEENNGRKAKVNPGVYFLDIRDTNNHFFDRKPIVVSY